jgi:hypothetical protein
LARAEVFQFSFCTFHFSSYLYSAFVPGERNSNSTPAQSATVIGNAADVYNQNPFSEIYKTEDFAKSPRWEFVFQFCIL